MTRLKIGYGHQPNKKTYRFSTNFGKKWKLTEMNKLKNYLITAILLGVLKDGGKM